MSASTQKLAVLFADISDSTALYENLGNQAARKLIAHSLEMLNDAIKTCQGTLIKTIGDEIMCTFPTAELALRSACQMQQAITSNNRVSEMPMHIRIGFNYGDVISEENDIFGDAVNVAARVTSITRSNQIMTTAAVVNLLPAPLLGRTRKIMRAEFKGKQTQIDIYQVTWEQEDISRTRIGIPAYRKTSASSIAMTLIYGTQSYPLSEDNPKLKLGRDESCDIVINSDFASREHADLEFRFGNFTLTDHSSNGTYIQNNERGIIHISNASALLTGKGSISLGQAYTDTPLDLIEYNIQKNS